jgi:hypothetical protein
MEWPSQHRWRWPLLLVKAVFGVTIRQFRCPRCGRVADIPRSAQDDPDAVIESLRREIRQLRETVACLRGSLGWQVPPRDNSRDSAP